MHNFERRRGPWLGDEIEAELSRKEGRSILILAAIIFGVPISINIIAYVICKFLI